MQPWAEALLKRLTSGSVHARYRQFVEWVYYQKNKGMKENQKWLSSSRLILLVFVVISAMYISS